MAFNEYGPLKHVAVRTAPDAFTDQQKVAAQWQDLRFHSQPDAAAAASEYKSFLGHLENSGATCLQLPPHETLTLDAIYTRDALIVSPRGLILCRMGRPSRRREPAFNAAALRQNGFQILGEIAEPGTLEGGDFIWLDESAAAVGLGPRTNAAGIHQLKDLLDPQVDLHIVPLPEPDHPEDVFHLMSMISPLDKDFALIYRPLMPQTFIAWLEARGFTLIDLPEDEFLAMGCNVLALGPRKVLMLDELPKTRAVLERAGCRVTTYKGDEISCKGEGGPTCLTRPLTRL